MVYPLSFSSVVGSIAYHQELMTPERCLRHNESNQHLRGKPNLVYDIHIYNYIYAYIGYDIHMVFLVLYGGSNNGVLQCEDFCVVAAGCDHDDLWTISPSANATRLREFCGDGLLVDPLVSLCNVSSKSAHNARMPADVSGFARGERIQSAWKAGNNRSKKMLGRESCLDHMTMSRDDIVSFV